MGLFTDGFKELKKASEPLYKSPKSIQETIEIMAVAENGIFEVSWPRQPFPGGCGIPPPPGSCTCRKIRLCDR